MQEFAERQADKTRVLPEASAERRACEVGGLQENLESLQERLELLLGVGARHPLSGPLTPCWVARHRELGADHIGDEAVQHGVRCAASAMSEKDGPEGL